MHYLFLFAALPCIHLKYFPLHTSSLTTANTVVTYTMTVRYSNLTVYHDNIRYEFMEVIHIFNKVTGMPLPSYHIISGKVYFPEIDMRPPLLAAKYQVNSKMAVSSYVSLHRFVHSHHPTRNRSRFCHAYAVVISLQKP